MAFAAAEFRLSRRMPDGKTRREHLETAAVHSVAAQLELEREPLSDAAAPVWDWYCEIAGPRSGNGFGLNPIGWKDLESWQNLTGTRLRTHERGWILELDRLFMADLAEEAKERAPAKKGRRS